MLAILTVFAMLGCPAGSDETGPGESDTVTVTFDPDYTGATPLHFTLEKDEVLGSTKYAQVQALQTTRSGFEFQGWATTKNGTPVSVTQNSKWTVNTTYYGLWEAEVEEGEPITITYNLNGFPGTAPADYTEALSGEAIGEDALPTLTTTEEGYTWLGWATTTDGTVITATAIFHSNQTLYARYTTSSPGQLTVTVDMQSGTMDADFWDETKGLHTSDVREKESSPAVYTFSMLCVTNDAENLYVAIEPAAGFGGYNPDSIILLIDNASSEADTGKTPTGVDDRIATTETITGTVEARIYMRMRDWAQGPKGVTGASQNITTWTQSSSDWLFRPTVPASPDAIKFAIPLSAIDNATPGTELKIFAIFTMGWGSGDSRAYPMPGSLAPEAAASDIIDDTEGGSTITIDMAEALSYTVKNALPGNNVIITYNLEGFPGNAPQAYNAKKGVAIGADALPALTATGRTFLGWSTTSTGIPIASTATFTANTTLHAIYNLDDITISYDLNGFPGNAPANKTVKYGQPIGQDVNLSLEESSGYTHLGWATTSTGISIASSATFTANQTLYARWEGPDITITYDLNGLTGATAPPDKTVKSGAGIGTDSLPPLSSTGYVWQGWATTTDGTPITASVFFTANQTLYARYVLAQATFAQIDMESGTLDADFSDPTKAASSTERGQITTEVPNYQIEGLYVANDGVNLYVALDFGTAQPTGFSNDRLVVWVDNTASSAGGFDTTAMKMANNQAITGSIEAGVYKRLDSTAGGTSGFAINATAWSDGSADPWTRSPTTPAGATVIKFSIPLASIGGAVSGNVLKVVAAFSRGWKEGDVEGANIVMGGTVPTGAFTFSADGASGNYWPVWNLDGDSGPGYITVDMDAALSYTVK